MCIQFMENVFTLTQDHRVFHGQRKSEIYSLNFKIANLELVIQFDAKSLRIEISVKRIEIVLL